MSWQLFRWTWRLDAPLFVGAAPAGALNRCRPYVPARAVWGAVTAELARFEGDDDQRYGCVGDELRRNARFSYLYPAESLGGRWLAWLPEYREGEGLVWVREGDVNKVVADRLFRRQLLWTRPATAIDPDNDSALDGSLREIECIQQHWRRNDGSAGSPVGLVGHIFLRDGKDLTQRLSAVRTLFVGGDTRYGLGRLERLEMVRAKEFFGAEVTLDDAKPRVLTPRPLGHAVAGDEVRMSGELEAIGGWDMTGQQHDRRVSGPVWAPGSQIAEGVGITQRFWIDGHGLWEPNA